MNGTAWTGAIAAAGVLVGGVLKPLADWILGRGNSLTNQQNIFVDRFEKEIRRIDADLAEERASNDLARAERNALTQQVAELQSKARHHEEEKEEIRQGYKSAIAEKEQQIASLSRKIRSLEAHVKDLEKRLTGQEAGI